MIEKVNPKHPDKIADRIAGAIVDLAYRNQENPIVAVEALIGHKNCKIIIESSVKFNRNDIANIVYRIADKDIDIEIILVKQDEKLAENQKNMLRCGDNGIFKGVPLTKEQKEISKIARILYKKYNSDGKYILDNDKLIICQSNAKKDDIYKYFSKSYKNIIINPLGEWTGGINVDTGATNRKLGSDMADSITGGGLHGKDLSKSDVSVNIYVFLKAQKSGNLVQLSCAIGDEEIDGKPYEEIVEIARDYINKIGGFEKLAEWGLF